LSGRTPLCGKNTEDDDVQFDTKSGAAGRFCFVLSRRTSLCGKNTEDDDVQLCTTGCGWAFFFAKKKGG
jgi:hypothetical protein